jgi:2-oxoglutarate ferredoxin oxidoreductase subunit delta
MAQGTIVIARDRCKGCKLCQMVCPQNLIGTADKELNPLGYHPAVLVDSEGKCTGCMICALICPDACIRVYRARPAQHATAGG